MPYRRRHLPTATLFGLIPRAVSEETACHCGDREVPTVHLPHPDRFSLPPFGENGSSRLREMSPGRFADCVYAQSWRGLDKISRGLFFGTAPISGCAL